MRTMKPFWTASLTIAVLAATLSAAWLADRKRPETLARPLESFPSAIDDWTGVDNPSLTRDVLDELRASSYLSRTYRRGDQSINLFIAYYEQQRAGENMHSPKNCLPGSGWELGEHALIDIPVNGAPVPVNKYFIEKAGSRALVIYWYQSRRRILARETTGKLLLIRDALVEGRTGGSIVRLTLPNQPGALEDGIAFAAKVIPLVQLCLGS